MEFEKLLRLMVEKGGSDLFITAGVPPSMKVNGKVLPVTKNALTPEQTREFVYGSMNDKQRAEFEASHECNFAISARGIGRFRVSAFSSATSAAWCCGGSRSRFRKLTTCRCPTSSRTWQ